MPKIATKEMERKSVRAVGSFDQGLIPVLDCSGIPRNSSILMLMYKSTLNDRSITLEEIRNRFINRGKSTVMKGRCRFRAHLLTSTYLTRFCTALKVSVPDSTSISKRAVSTLVNTPPAVSIFLAPILLLPSLRLDTASITR